MVEGTYTDFIKSIKTIEFGGFNGIEYSDGGFEPYISFQALLKWVGEYPNLFSAKFPIIKVDYESDKPLFMYSTSVSCDLSKCYIRNDYLKTTLGTFNPSIAPSFKNINTFTDGNYGGLNSTLKEEAGVIEDISMYPQIGNINFIYLSVTYLSELILKQSDNSNNKVTVGTFLQKVCDGVNKSLGSINDLQVITDVDGTAETLTIVDYQQKRIKGLPDIRKEEKRTITTIQAQGLGSMLTSIQAQSSITPELASTISIGAQAQSQPVGEEATSFSRLSRGFIDRVYPAKVQGDSEAALKREEDRKKAVENKFKQAISSYSKFIKNQIPQPGDSYSPVLLKSTDTTNISNIAVELYKSCLAMFTDTKQTSTAFIPIKLDISLYGIAGTKIYQKFKLSNDVLPLSYQGDYEFIILGVSHTVDSAKWETSISSLISLKDEKIKESGPDKPFSVKLSELDETTGSSTNSSGGSQPAGCPAPGTNIVSNGWGGFEKPFERTILTYQQAKAAIVAAAPGNKNLQIAILAVIIQEQGKEGKISGFNHNYGGFDITRGAWKFNTIGASNTNGYVLATEGGTKCRIAYVSFKDAASFFKVKTGSFKRKGFDKPLTGAQVAKLWYEKWNGYGAREFWKKNKLGYKDKYPNREDYDKFVVSNFEKQYYNVAKRLIG
jgi:hypothetical protein